MACMEVAFFSIIIIGIYNSIDVSLVKFTTCSFSLVILHLESDMFRAVQITKLFEGSLPLLPSVVEEGLFSLGV